MQIGMIGLGKMGGNMAERLRRAGHEVVGYDHHPENRDVATLAELGTGCPRRARCGSWSPRATPPGRPSKSSWACSNPVT